MRTLAMIGAGAIAALISVTGAFAWTQEQHGEIRQRRCERGRSVR